MGVEMSRVSKMFPFSMYPHTHLSYRGFVKGVGFFAKSESRTAERIKQIENQHICLGKKESPSTLYVRGGKNSGKGEIFF